MLTIKNPLVSVHWLRQNLGVSNLILLDASIPKVVENASKLPEELIPNSRFFNIKRSFSDMSGEFPNTFPSEEQFKNEAQKLGINTNSAIVIYDDKGIYSSPRAWWLFKVFGHDNVAVLDGGLPEWKRVGFTVVKKLSKNHTKGNFEAIQSKNMMCFFNDIVEISSDGGKHILDARSERRFKSLVPEPRKNLRSGTIPNSKNLPFTSILEHGKMKPKKELETTFNAFGNVNEDYVFSCGSGITACVLALGATLTGRENLMVYDGSWTEYGSLTEE